MKTLKILFYTILFLSLNNCKDFFDEYPSNKKDLSKPVESDYSYNGPKNTGLNLPTCTFEESAQPRDFEKFRLNNDKDGSPNQERINNQNEALNFVRKLMQVDIKYIAIENPISVISSHIRKPDQIIQPWQFGDKAQKTTCLWLKNLPLLKHTNIVEKGEFFEWTCPKTGKKKRQAQWYLDALKYAKTPQERRTLRSKTFKGIAEAMALQWGEVLKQS
jgi:hypothetical protein